MPYVKGYLRIVKRQGGGGPVDPDYGIDEGGRPGQGLPGRPERPAHPIVPPWERPDWPPGPVDPEWGIDEGAEIDNELPGEIVDPEQPPPGIPSFPIELPPGSIWPPLPPGAPTGKHIWLVYISGVGHRYGVFEIPEELPPKPERPDRPARPEHPIAPGGERPTQPIAPPRPQPKR